MSDVGVCGSFWEILRSAWDIRERYRHDPRYADCEFFFRGEYHSYHPYDKSLPTSPEQNIPGALRDPRFIEYEHEMIYEAMRHYPGFIRPDLPTIELLARMQHYGASTRLLDISEDLRLATAMAVIPSNPDKRNVNTAFVYVYAIKSDRIKYTDSDTVAAIAAMARLPPKSVDLEGDLGFLKHAIRAERPGFDIMEKSRDSLVADLQHLWCVKPLWSTERVRAQSGCFILFGNHNHKVALRPTFSHQDFTDEAAPSFGIERIEAIPIDGERKTDIRNELEMIGMSEFQYYPEFTKFAEVFKRQLTEKRSRHE